MTQISQASYDLLVTRRAAVIAEIAALSSTTAGGKPNTNQPGAADHQGYKRGLYQELERINDTLKVLDEELDAGGELGAAYISEIVP